MQPIRVWAPTRDDVRLVLDGADHPMCRGDDGWWTSDAAVRPGSRYAFRLDGGDPRPDPRSLSQPDGPHEASEVVDLDAYDWHDTDWRGSWLKGAIIYELHVGTFTDEGTLDAAAEHLDHLVDLGVTLVELMPVAAFPGERGWGYDGVSPYAVHAAYGGAVALQRFVDACHQRGLGVCLDVVHNHLGPSGNYLQEFGPYFTDRYSTPWGWAVNLDGAGSDEVRRYLLDNATSWLRDFHVDALRLDAVHELYDARAQPFLEELSAHVDALSDALDRRLELIAESDRNDPRTVVPRAAHGFGGMGVHGQWADDVHHALHVLLTGETQGYYADFADVDALAKVLNTPFFHDGTWSSFRGRHHGRPVAPGTPGWRFVASLQTHDQVGNRAAGQRLSHLVSPGRLACGAALLLTGPYTPMLFMGEEWGASTPWQYFTDHQEPELADAVSRGRRAEFAQHGWQGSVPDPQDPQTAIASTLRWDELTKPEHDDLLHWYRWLIRLRRAIPDLQSSALGSTAVTREGGVVHVRRGAHTVVLNLSAADVPLDLPHGEVVLGSRGTSELPDGTEAIHPDGVVVRGPNGGTEAHLMEQRSRG
ncbi:malto-oligosyltrehalose trehalohydrolase [Luteipulveratus halotolerans]|uniref:Malto-oligosyltrehalose trehalohydrolase n=1 Tax=Luteipulveratus halotolerans TaxID=1631356 RepID=A0A0L6CL29_9MICO|nr:malto-oligosyltrehalose trehalohydrolase [Luteipulveratus halotolerans]KNX38238.1 malto-oligosyltrehalose trehalohydrolase [Luteipulveratus halotolerans]